MTGFPACAGTYALFFNLDTELRLTAGRLGAVTLSAGQYVYVGSARGPGGLRGRLERHLRAAKPRHWHIDALTEARRPDGVIFREDEGRQECAWVRTVLAWPGAAATRGFGNSDCREGCPGHLVRLPDGADAPVVATAVGGRLADPSQEEEDPIAAHDLTQALLDAIRAGDDDAAEAAAQAMRHRPDLVPALRPLLADADPNRRWWAVRALALTGGPEAAELSEARLADADEAIRCAAALGLGELRAAQAIPALATRLADPSGWVRDSAADALALIGEPALPTLTAALADAHEAVRVRAAGALRKVVVPGLSGRLITEYPPAYRPAIEGLYRALNDPNRLVRHNAYEALHKLGLLESVLIAP